ncbi:uncharacterized protein PAC_01075 [Phialocephala subalpina]|uniref:AA1-like domain-containing protein n=1 Tax=Phialocephala subalpina TaxID=576137 RepID=A0A1L7WEI7_9HELO|nr:uncharacterized protein PAC_01075 [Phialocephala subalpina]
MQALILMLFTLSAFTEALPPLLPRQNCTAPTDFLITGFFSFYPSASNTQRQHYVNFKYEDAASNGFVTCSSITANGTYLSGDKIPCGQIAVCFGWNGTEGSSRGYLTIYREYCHGESALTGEVFLGTNCIPTEPPMPMGYGKECESPTVTESGPFSST